MDDLHKRMDHIGHYVRAQRAVTDRALDHQLEHRAATDDEAKHQVLLLRQHAERQRGGSR